MAVTLNNIFVQKYSKGNNAALMLVNVFLKEEKCN